MPAHRALQLFPHCWAPVPVHAFVQQLSKVCHQTRFVELDREVAIILEEQVSIGG